MTNMYIGMVGQPVHIFSVPGTPIFFTTVIFIFYVVPLLFLF
jgi:hypothetical protein